MKHTPGPWTIHAPKNCAGDQQNDRLIVDKDGNHIAETFQYQSHENPDGPSVANAQLIIAAPDMLEALKKIVNSWDNLHSKDRMQAREAIRKAGGGK